MTIFCSLYIWWFLARFWRLLLLPNHPHGQLMPETRRSFVARLRSLINEFPVINMRLPGNAPWCSIVLRERCRGCRGAALTRRHLSDCVCAVRQIHILSRNQDCFSRITAANFWRCKLQHIKHTKLTIAMSSLTPPCHIGGFFRLSWLSFADGYGRLEKSAFVVLSPK